MATREFEIVTLRPSPLRMRQFRAFKKANGFTSLNQAFDFLMQRTFNALWSRLDEEARELVEADKFGPEEYVAACERYQARKKALTITTITPEEAGEDREIYADPINNQTLVEVSPVELPPNVHPLKVNGAKRNGSAA